MPDLTDKVALVTGSSRGIGAAIALGLNDTHIVCAIRPAKPPVRSTRSMIPDKLKTRLQKHRPMTTVTVRMPEGVVASLKAIAPLKGMRGYQPLLKTYVSEGLRRDEAIYVFGSIARLEEALKSTVCPRS